jgi:hypothetical protein
MTLKHLLLFLTLALLFSLNASAQSPEQAPLEQEQAQKLAEQKKELERRTLALLDEIIAGIPSLRLPENRALVQSGAADLLWTRDEKRARALFREALNSLSEIINRVDAASSRRDNNELAAFQQRQEILQVIARRDSQFALESLRATRPQSVPADPVLKDRQRNREIELEQSLAFEVAANDPKLALQMAKDALSKGFSLELINVLRRLQAIDGEAASRLAEEIISKMRAEKSLAKGIAEWLAVEILQMTQARHSGSELLAAGQVPSPRTPLKLDEQYLRDLVELITASALTNQGSMQPDRFVLRALPPIMPLVEKWMPERAVLLRKYMADVNRGLDARSRVFEEYSALMRSGTPAELLDAAAKATTTETRDTLYEQAIWNALAQGDEQSARQISNDKIQDSSRRERILAAIERQSLWVNVMKGKIEEARQKLAHVKSKDERALILSHLALGVALKGEKKTALQLLTEARGLAAAKPKNETQLTTIMQIVRAYAVAEPARSFEMIETLVDEANELINAAATLDGFVGSGGAFRKGELVLPIGYANASARYQQYGKQLAALALVNFDRTKAAANRFQRKEVRIIASLFIAQGVLLERLGSGAPLNEGRVFAGY